MLGALQTVTVRFALYRGWVCQTIEWSWSVMPPRMWVNGREPQT